MNSGKSSEKYQASPDSCEAFSDLELDDPCNSAALRPNPDNKYKS